MADVQKASFVLFFLHLLIFIPIFLTGLNACEGQTVMSDQIIIGCCVIVLHHKPHHGQLWNIDGKLEPLVPHRVEACRDGLGVSFYVCLYKDTSPCASIHLPLFVIYFVSLLALSAGTPLISILTRGSTMDLALSLLILGSC